jgi:hypothetical protein
VFAVQFDRFGPPEVLSVGPFPEPHADRGEVRVRVRAAGISPVDVALRAGRSPSAERVALPHIPGVDAAGVVDEVGADVERVSHFTTAGSTWRSTSPVPARFPTSSRSPARRHRSSRSRTSPAHASGSVCRSAISAASRMDATVSPPRPRSSKKDAYAFRCRRFSPWQRRPELTRSPHEDHDRARSS